ncbi:MAG: HU family DNA-binding protein [Deltaproteobacteria bacterium]|nr:HU family DNA-binding protein [Deltaproteobacteria bacterium]
MSLTKAGIVDSISDQCDCSKGQSLELVESMMEIIKESLESGEDVLISFPPKRYRLSLFGM